MKRNLMKLTAMITFALCVIASNTLTAQTPPIQATDDAPKSEDILSKSDKLAQEYVAPDDIAATVNGVPITKEELNRAANTMMNMIKQSPKYQSGQNIPMDFILKKAIEVLIANELLFQRARELNLEVGEDELEAEIKTIRKDMSDEEFNHRLKMQGADLETFKGSILKSLYIRKLAMHELPNMDQEITNEEIQKFYDTYKNSLVRTDDTIRLSHIFIGITDNDTSEQIDAKQLKMDEIAKELDNGAQWNDMVEKYSMDEPSKVNDGDLGYFFRNQLPAQLSGDNIPDKVGGISSVIKSDIGFHIIKLTDEKPKGGTMTLEEAKPIISQAIMENRTVGFMGKLVEDLKKDAKIELFVK